MSCGREIRSRAIVADITGILIFMMLYRGTLICLSLGIDIGIGVGIGRGRGRGRVGATSGVFGVEILVVGFGIESPGE